MNSVLAPSRSAQPTKAVPLARWFAYTQGVGLEPYLARAKRGVSTLALSLVRVTLACRADADRAHACND
jgi:hypothetical protein